MSWHNNRDQKDTQKTSNMERHYEKLGKQVSGLRFIMYMCTRSLSNYRAVSGKAGGI